MTPASIAILAFSMSADACAAAVGRGAVHRPRVSQSVRAGAVFGAIEAVTPLVGWMLGLTAARFVSAIDHWIAFVLLTGIGGKMIVEALGRKDANSDQETVRPSLAGLIATAIGTSIDAAAVGVTLAFLNANIFAIALAIGLATFGMSTIGMLIGRAVGARFGSVVELLGGAGLIAIGTKILLEHTGVIG